MLHNSVFFTYATVFTCDACDVECGVHVANDWFIWGSKVLIS